MKPFAARYGDGGQPVLVLGFVTVFGAEVDAVVVSPEGGRVWHIPLGDVYEANPAEDWPVGRWWEKDQNGRMLETMP